MKTSLWLPSSSALLLILSGCTNQHDPNDPLGTGPYDAQGNYHEEWADDPSKWRKPGSRATAPVEEPPVIAKNDQPPPNANPLGNTTVPSPSITKVDSTPRETSKPVEVASRSRSTATKTTPKPTTKRPVTKAKSKPKPTSTRYTVKKGDTLSAIASRNGSSVSAIQKANGISGSLIRPGQSLVVPKRR